MTGVAITATDEPVQVRLGPVQETLLIPVYARALETARPNPLFRDEMSADMVQRIDYDFSRFDRATNVIRDVVVRTDLLDERVSAFIFENPGGQVINLGAGLDTRLSRLDNGTVHWVDLDMPDAIELRENFFTCGERNRVIPQSMFDPGWDERTFREIPPEQTLVVAEGLLMYFDPVSVKLLFGMLAEMFPGGRFLFQSTSPAFVGCKRQVPGVRETPATFGWGINDSREVESYDPRIRYIRHWNLIDRCRSRWGMLRWITMFPPVRNYVRRSMAFTEVIFDK